MKLRASAPGKVVLLGEYAVLFGAPALVMAADRRAIVDIESSERRGIEILAPDVHSQAVHAEANADGTLRWTCGADAAPAFALVTGLLRGLIVTGVLDPDLLACRLRLDTSAFFWNENGVHDKLGLGSSAALTVALASALAAHAGRSGLIDDRRAWLLRLLELHRQFQNGRGSGLDVACSLFGGVIRYTIENGNKSHVEPVIWPDALRRLMIWSGRSASTARFLEALDAWRKREPEPSSRLFREMSVVARAAAEAVGTGNTLSLLTLARDYSSLLQRLGDAAKIQVFTPEHLQIRAVVEAAGAVYKPCGAGGGDLGLALLADPAGVDDLRARLMRAGFRTLDLVEDPAGLRIEALG
jgi:phosphomevalonate kinase